MKIVRITYLLWFIANKSASAMFQQEFQKKKEKQQQQKKKFRHLKEDTLKKEVDTKQFRQLNEVKHKVLQFALGLRFTCALIDGPINSVKCFGQNDKGQLGIGNTEQKRVPTEAINFADGLEPVKIVAGWRHACALLQSITDGSSTSLWCWGKNTDQQLFDGTRTDQNKPVEATFPDDFGAVIDVEAGGDSTCIIFEDKLSCKGPNYSQQGTFDKEVSMIGVGFSHNCAILASHGNSGPVECSGYASDSQLLGSETELASIDAKQISVNRSHNCIIHNSDDTMSCWGGNQFGQLGNDSTSVGGIQSLVSPLGIAGLRVKRISLGYYHTCATFHDKNGAPVSPKCWGWGASGQLGMGSRDDYHAPHDISVSSEGTSIDTVDCGERHTCARFFDGSAKCWGFNSNGQLGIVSDSSVVGGTEREIDGLPVIDFGSYTVELTTSNNSWLIERDDGPDAVKVTFSDEEEPEVEILYRISAEKANLEFLNIQVMDKDCTVTAGNSIQFVEPDSARIVTNNGVSTYPALFNVDEGTIMTTNMYTAPTNEDPQARITTCIYAELLHNKYDEPTRESVSFVKTILTIPVSLTADFTIASFGAAEVLDDEISQDAEVNYLMDAFKCNAEGTKDTTSVPKNSEVRICITPQSSEIKITNILSLDLYQGDVDPEPKRQPIINGQVVDALTSIDGFGLGSEGNGAAVTTRITTAFYDDVSELIVVSGTVQLEFTQGGVRHRNLVNINTIDNGRMIQGKNNAADKSTFSISIELEDEIAEKTSGGNNLLIGNYNVGVIFATTTAIVAGMMLV